MKIYCLALLLFFPGWQVAFGQSYVESMLSHKITVNYPDHLVVATVKPISVDVFPQREKTYYWFSGNQINTTQGGYSCKLLNGLYEDFYLSKNLRESGNFEKGLKIGSWKSWTEQGILISEYTYKGGQRNGTYVKYDQQGKSIEKGSYHNDSLKVKHQLRMPQFLNKLFKKKPKMQKQP